MFKNFPASNLLARIAARAPRDLRFVLAAFAVPLVVRAVPEVIMGPYVVGFDTLAYYVPTVLNLSNHGIDLVNFLGTAPLLYALLWSLTSLGVPIVAAMKVLSPILYGFLGLSIFLYAKKGLEWTGAKSLAVGLLATTYFVTLRISWDMLRNALGLVFLFIALTLLLRSKDGFEDYVALSAVMILTVLTHQYVSVLLLSTVLIGGIFQWRRSLPRVGKLVLSAFPSLLLFLLILYSNVTAGKNFWTNSTSISAWNLLFGFSTPEVAFLNSVGFLVFCFLPLLPFIYLGFKKIHNFQFATWISVSLTLVVLAVVFPIYNPVGYRWILMLVFPLSFYAAEGLLSLKRKAFQLASIVVLASLTLSFVLLPSEYASPYYTAYLNYVPSSMLSNTVSLEASSDTMKVLGWASNNIENDDRLLTHDAFYGWATLVFREDQVIRYGYEDPESAAEKVLRNGQTELYLIWWVDEGWYGLATVPESFREVYRSGDMGLFNYMSSVT